jgi:transposase
MAAHYGAAVLPTRVRRPRDKAKVEVAVLIVERFILARLRNRRFLSLGELNEAIREVLGDLNARLMRKLGASRREFFDTIDRPALLPLPPDPYAYAEWRRCRVAPDYHVEVHGHFYSVPSRLIREVVEARITDTTIKVGEIRLEAACQRGLTIGARTYGSIASILKTGLDRAFHDETAPDTAPLLHANIRGRGYYH